MVESADRRYNVRAACLSECLWWLAGCMAIMMMMMKRGMERYACCSEECDKSLVVYLLSQIHLGNKIEGDEY